MVPWGHSVSLSGWWHIEPCLATRRCQEVIQSHCLDDGQLDCHKWPPTPIGVIGTFSDTLWEECRTLLLSFLDNYLPDRWLNILNIHNTNASLQTCMSFLVMSCHVTSCHVMLCKTVRLSRQSGCQDSQSLTVLTTWGGGGVLTAWLSWQLDCLDSLTTTPHAWQQEASMDIVSPKHSKDVCTWKQGGAMRSFSLIVWMMTHRSMRC